MKHPHKVPYLVCSDEEGNLFEDESLQVAARVGNSIIALKPTDFIELPFGSDMFNLPGRIPLGIDPLTGEVKQSDMGYASAAFVAPAHTQTHLAAWVTEPGAPTLPLYAYTALGWLDGKFYTTAVRVDPDRRQDCDQFNQNAVERSAKRELKANKTNRLLEHIAHCATVYICPAARNYFLNRWEAPLPTSPTCNSQCLGCISYQPKEHPITSTQNRITFVPTPEEIAEIATGHFAIAPNPIVSFGQGCEGEPILQWKTIKESIILMRKATTKGVINLNSNASLPNAVDELCKAGLDSLRVSMNSAREPLYNAYYKPRNYTFFDVKESMRIARRNGIWVSINYFVFPGITDTEAEFDALCNLISDCKINMIQWRNFNIDPEWFFHNVEVPNGGSAMGVKVFMDRIRQKFPHMYHGYFNPGREIIEEYLPLVKSLDV